MYTAIILACIALGVALTANGVRHTRLWRIVVGASIIPLTILFFAFLDFWGEVLWFESLGYGDRFWIAIWARVGFGLGGAVVAASLIWLFTRSLPSESGGVRYLPVAASAVMGLAWGLANWDAGLIYLNGVSTGNVDPILKQDAGFYLFTLPFLDAVYWLLLGIGVIALISALIAFASPRWAMDSPRLEWGVPPPEVGTAHRPLYLALGILGLVVAWGYYLDRFHLMYSTSGVVTGPGWTDVHIRLPAYVGMAGLTLILALTLFTVGLSPRAYDRFRARANRWVGRGNAPILGLGGPVGLVVLLGGISLGIAPLLIQWFVVEPNEITKEKPYIENNIKFTRMGFGLEKIEETEFPVSETLTEQTLNNNQYLLSQVRLWDPNALIDVYRQFQVIRSYYEFHDVDIDRYTVDGDYLQVMVSPREIEPNNLPEQSQTFVNRHFKYTHGFGLTLAPVSEFTPDGLPELLIKDVPPKSTSKDLTVTQPRIYYGELTDDYAVVNTQEEEFDYPQGDQNAYNRYSGGGGVELSSLWRKFLFGWKFDGTQFFFSSYPTRESRIMFHRQVRQRVQRLAPFLRFDADPYIVLDQGKLYWIIDGYTTSGYFPYSEPFFSGERTDVEQGGQERPVFSGVAGYLEGVNYIRNSVKAVVDAHEGTVDFYVFDPDDPIIQVWRKIYPSLFKDRDEMPLSMQAHARYPEGFLLAQGLVYAKYHMDNPSVFYNQEDLWVRATEKYYDQVRPVDPYYVMWQPPDSSRAEFILMMPFTPKNRQVLIGWVAGMCDPGNYGRLLAYRFPKEKRVLGTQQVDTKIDQDPTLSERLTLWNQQGSRVIRGNVLVIPLDQTLMYVEPIYLRAEAAAYPELRLVAVMHGDKLSYAPTFEAALEGLLKEGGSGIIPEAVTPSAGTVAGLVEQANSAFENYLRLQSQAKFREAAEELELLRKTLRDLKAQTNQPPKE